MTPEEIRHLVLAGAPMTFTIVSESPAGITLEEADAELADMAMTREEMAAEAEADRKWALEQAQAAEARGDYAMARIWREEAA